MVQIINDNIELIASYSGNRIILYGYNRPLWQG